MDDFKMDFDVGEKLTFEKEEDLATAISKLEKRGYEFRFCYEGRLGIQITNIPQKEGSVADEPIE